MENKI